MAEVKYNFGYPEKLIALHWDQLYLEWIPRVLATKSTADSYRELSMEILAVDGEPVQAYARREVAPCQSASPQPSPPFKKPDKPDKSGWQI